MGSNKRKVSIESMLSLLQHDLYQEDAANEPMINLISEISKKEWLSLCDSWLSVSGLVLSLFEDPNTEWRIRYWSPTSGMFLNENEKEKDTYEFVFFNEGKVIEKRPVSMKLAIDEIDKWFRARLQG
jgi:hypothetical protein